MESRSVASGCGCKEIYRFPHITSPYILSSVLYLFFLAAVIIINQNTLQAH